jgi:hypothetical protein
MRRYLYFVLTWGLSILIMGRCLANTPLQDMAIAALTAAHASDTGTQIEHGGMLIRGTDGSLRFFEPHVGDETGIQIVDFHILKQGELMMGTYHTHLCMAHYYHAVFSKQDVISAFLTGVPEFMLDECTGLVHEFDSRADQSATPRLRHRSSARTATSWWYRIVGDIGVTERMREAVNLEPCKRTPPAPAT